jgi:hypothetical protein
MAAMKKDRQSIEVAKPGDHVVLEPKAAGGAELLWEVQSNVKDAGGSIGKYVDACPLSETGELPASISPGVQPVRLADVVGIMADGDGEPAAEQLEVN